MTAQDGAERSLTQALVDYSHTFQPQSLDEETRSAAKAVMLDLFGTMLAASSPRYSAVAILERFLRQEGGNPLSSIVGRAVRTSPSLAALVNGTLGYYCDSEPHHGELVLHPAAVTIPAALATAEAISASGEQFMTAVVLGVDVACRMSAALDPRALYARGFHPTSVAGAFGAAAASGYLRGLSAAQWHNAYGLASQQACGLLAWASDHTEHSRPFNPGLAARNGVTAASLAALGFGGPPHPLDGKHDCFSAFSGVKRPERLVDRMGTRLYIKELAFKLYASCSFLHPGLDALLSVMSREHLTGNDLESIDLHFPRSGAVIIDNNELKSHNAQYILAVAAQKGGVTIDDILHDRLTDPVVLRLSRNCRLIYDDELDKLYPKQYSSIVVLRTRNGRVFRERVDWPKGCPENPLSSAELQAKYRGMAARGCSERQAEHILDLVMNIDSLGDTRALGSALSVEH